MVFNNFLRKIISSKPKCPYCHRELPKFPLRKSKCPYCKEVIFIKRRPSSKRKILVTKEEAEKIEKEWEEVYFRERLRDDFGWVGFSEKDYYRARRILKRKFGTTPSHSDIYWYISNLFLEKAAKKKDLEAMRQIYFRQALFLHEEGKDCFLALQMSRKCELLQYQQQGIKKVRISTTGDRACENCKLLEGKVFSIEEALEKMPLPVKNCLHKLNPDAPTGWCRCLYEPVLENEELFKEFWKNS